MRFLRNTGERNFFHLWSAANSLLISGVYSQTNSGRPDCSCFRRRPTGSDALDSHEQQQRKSDYEWAGSR